MKLENIIETYDAIVIGSGHAGSEAALSLARLGKKTLLTTLNLDSSAFLACNPSIGYFSGKPDTVRMFLGL